MQRVTRECEMTERELRLKAIFCRRCRFYGIILIGLVLSVAFCGCAGDYTYAIDCGSAQVGCRYTVILPEEGVICRTQEENQGERKANFRFGFPWWVHTCNKEKEAGTTINGIILSPLLNIDCGTLNGAALSCIFAQDKINGLLIAPLFSMTEEMNGISLSCWNWSSDKAGFQVGLINFCAFLWAPGDVDLQIGILNEAGRASFQTGLLNNSWVSPRIQFGLVNTVEKPNKFVPEGGKWPSAQIGLYNDSPGGFQIGLLNRNERSRLWKWCPLINF